MLGDPRRQNHPMLSYLIGLIFAALSLVVLAGVLYHLTFSPYGPELLKSLKDKYFPEAKSPILEEAKRQKDLEIHRHFHHIVDYPQVPKLSDRCVSYATRTFHTPKIKKSGRF